MPDDSPFRCSWWYRTEFTIPARFQQKTAWLHFDGINYRANVWLNGRQLADAKDMAGAFRAFEFDVSKLVAGAKENALAVEVFAPEKNSLAITWVDWNPAPPDKDMGLWKDVYLTGSGEVALRHPFVSSKLDADYKTAALTISAEVHNVSDHSVEGVLRAEIGAIRLNQPVQLGPSETKKISLRARPVHATENPEPEIVVAVPNGRAAPVHRPAGIRERRTGVRRVYRAFRNPRGEIGDDGNRRSALPDQRQDEC